MRPFHAVAPIAACCVLAATVPSLPAVAAPAAAALDLRKIDVTATPFAREFGEKLRARLAARADSPAFASFAPGWTATQVGNVVYLQDDGTNDCDGNPDNSWFEDCVSGAVDAFFDAFPQADPDFLSVYLGWDIDFFFAFYSPIANDVRGIGMQHFAGAETFGNANGLQGFIFMNSIQLYDEFGASFRDVMFDMIWGQEFGHRWGAFVHVEKGDLPAKALLGRDEGHWSYFLDSEWSWMEGNDWEKDGGAFTTDFDSFGQPGYSALDLYLMGLIPASAVPDFFLITDAETNRDPEDPPQVMSGGPVTIDGKSVTISIDDVIAAEGERSPSFDRSRRAFQVSNVVILRSTDSPSDATMQARMEEFDEWTRTHFARDTRNLAAIHTGIADPPENPDPTAAFTLPAEAEEGKAVTLDATGSSDPDGEELAYVWDFGDGSGDYTSGPTVEHAFRRGGELTVTLTVVDEQGGSASLSQAISVADEPGDDGPLGCGCRLTATRAAAPGRAAIGSALWAALLAGAVAWRRRG